jgi:hypothetical protein
MQELYKYLCKSVLLLERKFDKKDWIAHGHKYVNTVIELLLSNNGTGSILTANGDIKFVLSEQQQNELIELSKSLTDDTNHDRNIFNNILKDTGITWNTIIKTPFSVGSQISTVEQETATCLVFNELINIKKELDVKLKVKEIASKVSENFSDVWLNTFHAQSQFIFKLLNRLKLDPSNFRLRRFGDDVKNSGCANDETIEQQQKIINTYSLFLENYGKACNDGIKVQKDIYDPSDVFLIDITKLNEIQKKLNDLCKIVEDTTENSASTARNLYQNFYKNRCAGVDGFCGFYGISLKQLHIKDKQIAGHIGIVNMTKDVKNQKNIKDLDPDDNDIKVKSIDEFNISDSQLSIRINLSGNFNLEDMYFDSEEQPHNSNCILSIRSGGSNRIYVDTKFANNEPSLGKCPIAVFRKVFDDTIGNKNDVKDITSTIQKKYFEKTNNGFIIKNEQLEQELKDRLTICVQASIKRQPFCLPFIIIH